MTLPTMLPHGRDEFLAWCTGIDAGPFASLAVPERVTYTSHSWIAQLAAAAAVTERIELWTTIVVLPAHDAVDVAKQLASVDQLSNGRLTVGVGVGGREHDYRAIGGSFTNRWERLDDQVATMRRIWGGVPPFAGADLVGPPPIQPDGPRIISGAMGPKSLARAARWADGVTDGSTVFGVDANTVTNVRNRVLNAWSNAGRTKVPHVSASIWYGLGPDAESRLQKYCESYMANLDPELGAALAATMTCHNPQALKSSIAILEESGFDEVFLVPTTADPTELDRTIDALS